VFGQCYAHARALSSSLVLYSHLRSIDPHRTLSHLCAEAGRKNDLKTSQNHEKIDTRGPRPKPPRGPGGPPRGPCGGGYQRSRLGLHVCEKYTKSLLQNHFPPFCCHNGPWWAPLVPSWAPVGSTPGPSWAPVGSTPVPNSGAQLGPRRLHSGAQFGPPWAPLRGPGGPPWAPLRGPGPKDNLNHRPLASADASSALSAS